MLFRSLSYFFSGETKVRCKSSVIACNQLDLVLAPLVHSTSYGANERFTSKEYMDRTSEDLMKFGATGHSVFFSLVKIFILTLCASIQSLTIGLGIMEWVAIVNPLFASM